MTAEPLKPCPWCQSTNIEIWRTNLGKAFVNCNNCLGSGPYASKETEAIAAWNRREPIGNSDELLPEWVKKKISGRIHENCTVMDTNNPKVQGDTEALEWVLSLKKEDS